MSEIRMMAASPYGNTMGIENDGISNEVEVWFLSTAIVEAADGTHRVRVEAVNEPSLAGWWMNIGDMNPVSVEVDLSSMSLVRAAQPGEVIQMGEVEPGESGLDRHQDLESWLAAEERHEERIETMNQWLAAEAEYEATLESDDATE